MCVPVRGERQPNLPLEEGSLPSRGPSDLQLRNILPPHVFISAVDILMWIVGIEKQAREEGGGGGGGREEGGGATLRVVELGRVDPVSVFTVLPQSC